MFSLFIVLLSFSTSLATKCFFFHKTALDLNLVEFQYYRFMISLNKFDGSCNVLYPKKGIPKKKGKRHKCYLTWQQKKIELKRWQNIFHGIVNANLMVQFVIQIKNLIIKQVNVNVKTIVSAKKIIIGILAHVFVKVISILKSIADKSMTKCG